MKKQKQPKKKDSQIIVFIKTFLIAFVLIVAVTTPALGAVSKVVDINPGGDDAVILDEDWDYLIPEDSPFFEAFTNTKRVNMLLLGVNGGLTDTIMLVSFDTQNKHVDVISLPRDTYYHREGYSGQAEDKLNAAYKKNPVNTAKAVSEILMDIPINYYAVIEYEGIEKIVDAMGGVPMNIPFNMKYSDPYDKPPLYINIPKGEQVLNGKQAVQFLRYRSGYAEGDIGRVKAQQEFVKNAFKQCLSFDLPKIATTAYNNITSDMKLKTVLSLASKASGITSEGITTYMMPGYADPDPPYYVYPKSKEIAEMLTEIYSIGTVSEAEDETEDGADAAAE